MDPAEVLQLGQEPGLTPSLTQVLRTLKQRESGAFNCVASCLDDAEFVGQIAARYAPLPTYANLRWVLAGGWQLAETQAGGGPAAVLPPWRS